ncbi:GFA family protein [Sphingomonas sp. CFBP 13733]|uniref:GFA family protein n=1 Tax=Sphingomonas sp. CFBP 13733 TaxID=2775291 RepID=UPI0018D93018
MRAQCQCGQLTVELPGPSPAVVACHCIACQRRSGSPFGVLAYYPEELLAVAGEGKRFERATDEGNRFETVFCPECGSTVYARTAKHPSMIGSPWALSPILLSQLPFALFGRNRCITG